MTQPSPTAQPKPAAPAGHDLQLLRLMQELVGVMEQEITVVEERLQDALPDLVARKQRLLADYQAEFKAATAQPEWLQRLPSAQKQQLKTMGQQLEETGKRNARAVKAAAQATQRFLQGVMATVRDEKCARSGYEHLVQPAPVGSTQAVLFKTTA